MAVTRTFHKQLPSVSGFRESLSSRVAALVNRRSIIMTAAFLAVMQLLSSSFPEFWLDYLGKPAASLASIYLSCPLVTTSFGFELKASPLPIHVTGECSAAGFFALIAALIFNVILAYAGKPRLLSALLALSAAFTVTVIANSARIILAWHTGRLARLLLPDSFWPAVHLGTGVLVFVVFLVLTYAALNWWFTRAR